MNNREIAQKIVDKMLDTINTAGYLPWAKPWTTGKQSIRVLDGWTEITVPVRQWNRAGKPYNGINPLLLNMSGKTGEWITFNQCKAEKGTIRKGAKGQTIVYWSMIRKEDPDELDKDGNPVVHTIPVLKYYTVFNVETDTDLEVKHRPEPQVLRFPRYKTMPVDGLDTSKYEPAAEDIIADYVKRCQTLQLDREGVSNSAYYSPAEDRVVVPNIGQFGSAPAFYSTLFHELGHSTGHVSRLDRFTGKSAAAAWGDQNYAREELVAEITAASILSTLGMETGNTERNSAAYVKSWSEKIKNDPMMFVVAAGRAEKAIDLILGTC